jgi:hypothetical protein
MHQREVRGLADYGRSLHKNLLRNHDVILSETHT